MKQLVSVLLWACTLSGAPAELTRQVVLDPSRVVRIPVARDRLTVVRFPSAISDLEGAFLSPEAGPPALFQISFRPGNAFFTLRALATNSAVTVLVGWRGQTYVLECTESGDPLLSVVFVSPVVIASPKLIPARPTPARLQAMLQTARLYDSVEKQQPQLLAQVERATPRRRLDYPDCEIVLEEIFRFEADDALVFHATLHNKTIEPLLCKTETLTARVGQRIFFQAATESDVTVPSCGHATVFFAIAAGVKGTPDGISIQNDFSISFERVGQVAAARCPSPETPKAIRPARSPKHESLLPPR